jgi:phosphate transport system substrate-binding protein
LSYKKWLLVLISVLIVIPLISASCSESPATTTSEPSGTLTEAGSTTVQPLAQELADAFHAMYPKVTVTVNGGGSAVGIKSAEDGTVDIGAASRDLTPEEAATLVETTIARDGIAIVVNPAQTKVNNLTKAQVTDIFSGKITNWKDVGGDDKPIVVVSREEGSGTRTAFQELIIGNNTLITASAILQSSNGAVRSTVASNPDAISYLSFGYIDSSVKALSLEGVPATVENARNGTYPAVRPLLFLTKTQPTGLVKLFIDYCLGSEGQQIVAKDYIPVR